MNTYINATHTFAANPTRIVDPFFFSWERQINTLNALKEAMPKAIPSYPPCNIIKTDEEAWTIEMALAGFKKDDLTITIKEGTLTIKTNFSDEELEEDSKEYIHKGIAHRAFQRDFSLADDVKVLGSTLEEGMLRIYLEREIPEEKKPKLVEIRTPETIKQINS